MNRPPRPCFINRFSLQTRKICRDHKKGRITEAKGEKQPQGQELISKGSLYLSTGSGERKSSGAFYTPDFVVDYIVEETLRPLCDGKPAEQILNLKVCDPAMGSGHFLLGAIRYLERRMLEKLFETDEKAADIDAAEIRWNILHNCVFGVDTNPIAVELAKFSLWIYTVRPDFQLEPLSDQLKCTNSLTEENWPRLFPGVFQGGGFSAVIGNPPYVRSRLIDPKLKEYLAKNYEVASYQPDTFAFFMELSLDLLREGGSSGMIVPNGLLTNTFYGTLRRYLLENSHLKTVVDLKGGVFAGAAVDTSILVFSKPIGSKPSNNEVLIGEWPARNHGYIQSPSNSVPQKTLLALPNYVFNSNADNKSLKLTDRIKKRSIDLGELCDVKAGMKVRKDFVQQSKTSKCSKKFLLGRDIAPYCILWSGRWVIYDRELESKFSNQAFRDEAIFTADEKILVRQVSSATRLFSVLDRGQHYCDQTLYVLLKKGPTVSMPLLQGIVSSRLMAYFYGQTMSDRKETFPKIKGDQIKKLPIKHIPQNGEEKRALEAIVRLVNKSYSLMEEANQKKLQKLMAEIDAEVYRLYGMSAADVTYIEDALQSASGESSEANEDDVA